MTQTFTDSAFPDIQKVGSKLFSLSECNKFVSHNYQALEQKLKEKLNFPKDQWQLDIEAAGGKIATAQEVDESLRPRAWEIVRVVGQPSGHFRLDVERPHSEGSKTMQKLTVMTSDLDDSFVASFDEFLNERLQPTIDRIVEQKERILAKRESDKRSKEESELIKAKKVLQRDAQMSDTMRRAYHADKIYVATLEGAAKVIAAQSKPKKKAGDSAMVRTNKQLSARASVKYAEQAVTSRKKILAIRTKRGKQSEIDEAQSELDKAEKNLTGAELKLSSAISAMC